MANNPSKKEVTTNVPERNFWDTQESMQQKEDVIKRHNAVEEVFKAKLINQSKDFATLIESMLEIADVILKNTCGIGSNFKLAECDLSKMTRETITEFFNYVLILMGYHFGQLIPGEKEELWKAIQEVVGDETLCASLEKELINCKDHEDDMFSPIRAGRLLWEKATILFGIKNGAANTPARIYYQTAPGQDLMYILENSGNERWLNFR